MQDLGTKEAPDVLRSKGSSRCLLVCVGFDAIPDNNSMEYFGFY